MVGITLIMLGELLVLAVLLCVASILAELLTYYFIAKNKNKNTTGCFSASLMFLLVKLLADASTFMLLFYRGLVQVVLSFVALRRAGVNPLGPPEVRLLLVLRATLGAAAVCAWFFGAQVLPLPDAVTLQFTSPAFAAIFAVCFVGEKWLPLDMVGAVVCLTGVALIAHPTWLFGSPPPAGEQDAQQQGGTDLVMQALAVMITTAGSALAGLAYVSVRAIGHRASAVVMVFYYGAVSLPVAAVGSALFEGTWDVVSIRGDHLARDSVLVFLIGVLGHAGQWLLNLGLQKETAATATLATCTQIVWTYIFELAFLHEALNRWSVGGSGLILGYMVVVAAVKIHNAAYKNSPKSRTDGEEVLSEGTPLLPGSEDDYSGGVEADRLEAPPPK